MSEPYFHADSYLTIRQFPPIAPKLQAENMLVGPFGLPGGPYEFEPACLMNWARRWFAGRPDYVLARCREALFEGHKHFRTPVYLDWERQVKEAEKRAAETGQPVVIPWKPAGTGLHHVSGKDRITEIQAAEIWNWAMLWMGYHPAPPPMTIASVE